MSITSSKPDFLTLYWRDPTSKHRCCQVTIAQVQGTLELIKFQFSSVSLYSPNSQQISYQALYNKSNFKSLSPERNSKLREQGVNFETRITAATNGLLYLKVQYVRILQ